VIEDINKFRAKKGADLLRNAWGKDFHLPINSLFSKNVSDCIDSSTDGELYFLTEKHVLSIKSYQVSYLYLPHS